MKSEYSVVRTELADNSEHIFVKYISNYIYAILLLALS